MSNPALDLWCIRFPEAPFPVRVVRARQNGQIIFRDAATRGTTYAARHIREWAELTDKQRTAAWEVWLMARRKDASFRAAKDGSLAGLVPAWNAQAQAVYNVSQREGFPKPPPRYGKEAAP